MPSSEGLAFGYGIHYAQVIMGNVSGHSHGPQAGRTVPAEEVAAVGPPVRELGHDAVIAVGTQP